MLINRRATLHEYDLASLSHAAVEGYQVAVRDQYPGARWIADQDFGRVVVDNLPLSLRFSMIDPLAEAMAWRDASQRLGDDLSHPTLPHHGLRRRPLVSVRHTR